MPDEEKTEEASQRRIEKSREKGDVAKSRELPSAIGLLLGLLTLKFFGSFIVNGMQDIARSTLTQLNDISIDPLTVQTYFIKLLRQIGLLVSPIFAVMLLTGVLINYLQVGPLLSAQALSIDFTKLDPIKGFKQLFSKQGVIETVKALLKLIIIGSIGISTVWSDSVYFQSLGSKGIVHMLNYAASMSFKIGIRIAFALLLLGILDLFYQRWNYAQKLRMTKHEAKEERKESELAPEVKRVLQERQLSAAQKRMMTNVPEADVVITNPKHIAVALVYDRALSESPVVVAKGADFIAEKIKEIAREHDVPIIEDKPLAWALYDNVELDETIPGDLYQAVAQVLARVYQMTGKLKG